MMKFTGSTNISLTEAVSVGGDAPCLLIAEIGNNHQGDENIAGRMVRAAAEAGAGAVKFQKRDSAALLTRRGLEKPYEGENSFGATYGEHREALELGGEAMARLRTLAHSLGLACFASCWDMPSLEIMLEVGMDCVKIGSADLVNLPMLHRVARAGLPVLLSTGMSDWSEVDAAVDALAPCRDRLVLLHCNSSYPCPDEQTGVRVMAQLHERYGLPVGYSGHERGIGPSVAAATLGACAIERHFTLDTSWRGTDHAASLDPQGFSLLADAVRGAEASLRVGEKQIFSGECGPREKLRKSVVFSRDLAAGHFLTETDLTLKCPGDGVSPLELGAVVGRTLAVAVHRDEQFGWDQVVAENGGSAKAAEGGGK